MHAPLTNTTEIAKRAYDKMRDAVPTTYVMTWDQLPVSVQAMFEFMVAQGSEAAWEAILLGNASTGEGASCH